jgi:hypothetical protein
VFLIVGPEKPTFTNPYSSMEAVGLQYGADEFVEAPVADARYSSPKPNAPYASENFYDSTTGNWYTGNGSGSYNQQQQTSTGYHNVNPAHLPQQAQSHEHYGMSPHMESPHLSATPQPLPPMSSFRGPNGNGPSTSAVVGPPNPNLYNSSIPHHASQQQHNISNDTLVGKALQTVSLTNGWKYPKIYSYSKNYEEISFDLQHFTYDES